MDPQTPRTPSKAPHLRSKSFVKSSPSSSKKENVDSGSESASAGAASPQRPITSSAKAGSSATAAQRPVGASNRDIQKQSPESFRIHRPSAGPARPSSSRPVLAKSKQPSPISAYQQRNGSPVRQTKRSTPPARASTAFPQGPSRPSNRNHGPYTARTPPVMTTPTWASYPEYKFRVVGLPPDWSTKEVYAEMAPLGTVTYIDLSFDRRTPRGQIAFVTFTPPPRDFTTIRHGLRGGKIGFEEIEQKTRPAEVTSVIAARIDFGVMKSEDTMLGLHSAHTSPHDSVEVSVKPERKRMEIEFSVPSALFKFDRKQKNIPFQWRYRVQINLAQILSISQSQNPDTGATSFVISIDAPPLLYRKTNDPLGSHEIDSKKWREWKLWYRHVEIEQDQEAAKRAVKQLQRDTPIIDVGRWLTYQLSFDGNMSASKDFAELQKLLEQHSSSLRKDRPIKTIFAATKAMAMWSWLDSPVAALEGSNGTSSLSDLQQMAHQTIQLPFEVRYQLESCISHGRLHESNIDKAFLERLAAMAAESEHGKLRAVKLLEKVVDDGERFYGPNDIFRRVVPNMRSLFEQREHAVDFVKVRTATITPTMIYFNAASLEPSNRVIRHFRHHEDRFLRVRFTDEKYKGKVHGSEDRQDEVFTRVHRVMTNGIKVGDRHYEFLAFGNSQFREHGAYFFAATSDLNAAKIREWMGNFSHIKIVAKYCSRIGQCLSTTRATQNKTFKEIKIPDIERNGFCFTDGVGKISHMLTVLILSEVGMLKARMHTSAFQFRMGGCKGVLVLDPDKRSELSVAIRPSQEKFPTLKHAGLEICRISQFTNASLNVQIILVLSALGVADEVFVDMMDAMLFDIELAMTDQNKAIELLQKNIDLNQATVQVAQMILDGFMDSQDPFMISCLRLWRSWNLKYLKEKQRIFVEHGAFVLGCIDETATLEGHYDDAPDNLPEIFLQVPDRDNDKEGTYRVVEGACTLARNPSLHPGDIRIVRAVKCEKLMHIRDCVVLPQKGDRDIANMCSGGDLDGDDYLVIWDKNLLPKEWNHPPMDYQAPPPVEAQGEITVDDMTSFFVTHMKYDNIGLIATLHRCFADREDEGVKSPECLELAALHSKAVDYAKTGQPAELPERLLMPKRPHWTGKENNYTSKKVIGKLYDRVRRAQFVPAWDLPFDARILNAYELHPATLERARDMKEQYDEAVRRIMAKYDIKSEFEVWSTFVLEHCEDYNDYKFTEKIGEEVFTLKERFQKLCHEQIGAEEVEQKDWANKGPFIAAMYTVTAREVAAALDECNSTKIVGGVEVPVKEKRVDTMPFMSFPWIFHTELGWIANKRTGYAKSNAVTYALSTGSKRTQQAVKTRLRHEILGDVPEPAPLEELVLRDDDLDMEDGVEEVDLLDVRYTGPRMRASLSAPNIAASSSTPQEVPQTETLPDTGLESDTGESSMSTASATKSYPLPIADATSDAAGDRLAPVGTIVATDVEDTATVEHATTSRASDAAAALARPTQAVLEDHDDYEDEAEEVILAPAPKKSAFDALEELLES